MFSPKTWRKLASLIGTVQLLNPSPQKHWHLREASPPHPGSKVAHPVPREPPLRCWQSAPQWPLKVWRTSGVWLCGSPSAANAPQCEGSLQRRGALPCPSSTRPGSGRCRAYTSVRTTTETRLVAEGVGWASERMVAAVLPDAAGLSPSCGNAQMGLLQTPVGQGGCSFRTKRRMEPPKRLP